MFNRTIARAVALAGASLGAVSVHSGLSHALARQAEAREGRIYGYENIRRHILRTKRPYRLGNFSPRINKWTGKPHEHRMERARRLTAPGTEARRTAEMAARAGFAP